MEKQARGKHEDGCSSVLVETDPSAIPACVEEEMRLEI